jgi:hypothetical protein
LPDRPDTPDSLEESLRARFVKRAAGSDAPLLATPLERCARSQNLSWSEFAVSLGCPENALDRLACCKPPRAGHLDADIAALSSVSGIEPLMLKELLGRLVDAIPESDPL